MVNAKFNITQMYDVEEMLSKMIDDAEKSRNKLNKVLRARMEWDDENRLKFNHEISMAIQTIDEFLEGVWTLELILKRRSGRAKELERTMRL